MCVCVRTLTIQYTNVRIRRRGCAEALLCNSHDHHRAPHFYLEKKTRRLANDCGKWIRIFDIYIYILFEEYICVCAMHYAVYVVWLYIYIWENVCALARICVWVCHFFGAAAPHSVRQFYAALRVYYIVMSLCAAWECRAQRTLNWTLYLCCARTRQDKTHIVCGCVLCIGRRRTDRTTTRRCLWFVIRLSYVHIYEYDDAVSISHKEN